MSDERLPEGLAWVLRPGQPLPDAVQEGDVAHVFPAPSVTLSEFLLARIAEDETDGGLGFWCGEWRCQPSDAERDAARSRVLAECEAKRRIVDLHALEDWECVRDEGGVCVDERVPTDCTTCFETWPCLTLRALALPYASHPDYPLERDEAPADPKVSGG